MLYMVVSSRLTGTHTYIASFCERGVSSDYTKSATRGDTLRACVTFHLVNRVELEYETGYF